jgi:hypothetical protein
MLLAFLLGIAGLILDTVTKGRRELRLLAYLSQRAPGEDWNRRQSEVCVKSGAEVMHPADVRNGRLSGS